MYFYKNRKTNNKGFTLVELLLTVVILALVAAPFLSSFVSASKANVSSKRIQEANELGEYIIEQFKVTSIEELISSYKLQEDNTYKIDGNAKTSVQYKGSMSNKSTDVALPAGYRKGYSADIVLTPSKTIVNGDYSIPVIDNLNKKECTVINDNIKKYDGLIPSTGGLGKRNVTVEINKISTDKYTVKLTVEVMFCPSTYGSTFQSYGEYSMLWEYTTIPDVYILYNPLTSLDNITIKNMIYESSDYQSAGKKVNVYLINQQQVNAINPAAGSSKIVLSTDNIKVIEKTDLGVEKSYSLSQLTDKNLVDAKIEKTTLYTNIKDFSKEKDNGNVNGTVKMVKIDTVYNLDVTVNYNDKKVSDYNSTKVIGE